MRNKHIFVNGAESKLKVRFCASKTGLSPLSVNLLTVQRRLIYYRASLFVRLLFHIWRLLGLYFFFISLSFITSGGLCFMTAAFLECLKLYFLYLSSAAFSTQMDNVPKYFASHSAYYYHAPLREVI